MNPTVELDLRRLLHLARGGNQAARGELLESYHNYLTLLARLQVGRLLRSKIDAADLVQETFLEAHCHFAAFQGSTEAELTGWLHGILATTVHHLLRRYLGTQRRDVRLERAKARINRIRSGTDEIGTSAAAAAGTVADEVMTLAYRARLGFLEVRHHTRIQEASPCFLLRG